jgi:tetratricopeptide (TPR) repeat protein
MVKSKVVLLFLSLLLLSCQNLNPQDANTLKKEEAKVKAAEFFNKMGLAAIAELNYSKAIANFKRATEIKPDDPEYWNNLGKAYMLAKFYKEAEKAFYRALKLKPDYGEAILNLGILYYELGNYEKAIHWLQKAAYLETYEERYKAFYQLAQVYKKLGKETLYVMNLQKAINLYPLYKEALLELIDFYKKSGDIDKALSYYKQYLLYYPRDYKALLDYSELLIKKGKLVEAKKVLKFVIENARNEEITQRAYKLVNRILLMEVQKKTKTK